MAVREPHFLSLDNFEFEKLFSFLSQTLKKCQILDSILKNLSEKF